ncbi:MAG TPA: CHAT domain-containing protein [Thermoanaerobaculia bacterium]|nr:CHAT domain-containing protein [Thermoanaerobaculia bacterium]
MKMRWSLAALCLVVASLGWLASTRMQPAGSAELAVAAGGRRLIAARLSGGFSWEPCERLHEPGRAVARFRCSAWPEPGAAERRVPQKALAGLQAGAAALLLLPRDDSSVDQAIARLSRATERDPGDARILNDLGVAYFVRAQQNDNPQDLLLALRTADRAVWADGRLPEARFNRALVLQEMFLSAKAWLAWQAYLDLDEETGWADEARARLEELNRPQAAEIWGWERRRLSDAALRRDRTTVREIVARFRQPARLYGEDVLLAEWAEARAAGDLLRAGRSLEIARAIGGALVDLGGDAMVHDAVAEIARSQPGSAEPERLRSLIEGHRAYGRGLRSLRQMEIDQALPDLRAAERALATAGSPFVFWARLQLASCAFFHERFGDARRLLEAVDGSLPSGRYPGLRGRLHFIVGSMDGLQGRPGDSLERWRRARELFLQAGDAENLAMIDQHFAIVLGSLGSEDAWRPLFRALRQLPEIQTGRRVFAILDEAGIASLRQGRPEVALEYQNELLSFALRQRDPELTAAALQRRAGTLAASGRAEKARADLDAAVRQADKIVDAKIRARMQADIALSRGQVHLASRPEIAEQELTEAIRFFEESPYRFDLSLARVLRARAHLATGNGVAAGEDFQASLREIESSRENLADERLRIVFADQATHLFDEILSFEAGQEGGAVDAFDLAEQTRARELLEDVAAASLAEPGAPAEPRPRPLSVVELQRALPERTLVLKYAVLPDRVLLWSVTRRELRLQTIPVELASLEARVREVTAALRTGRGERAQLAQELGKLYALLLGPAEAAVRAAGDLVVIPDKALHRLPFAALVDPRSGRHLVQDHAVAMAPSVNVYVRCLARGRSAGPPATALVVGNPRFDPRELPALAPLPGAEAEAVEIAALYPRSHLLIREQATPRAFLEQAARGPEVLQISAHAILSAAHPEYSRLVLARDGAASGSFYMHEVRSLDLRPTRLVVLAGCNTGGGRLSISEGSLSFARSFLAAGAPAVIASLWDVDDAASRELLTDLHRRIRSGEDPMSALRRAQLARLGTEHSWNWAAYEFIGGSLPTTKEGQDEN